jgi:release factor glutamine methyltransferase
VWTVVELLRVTAPYLAKKGSASARLDAELLLAETLGLPGRVELYLQHDRPLTGGEVEGYRELVRRRSQGEPVAYLLGRARFYEEELEVTPAVLVPRPDTETLVEAALARLPMDGTGRLADVGTGSGAVAIALARKRQGLTVVATELSPTAAAVARRNVARYGLEARVQVVVTDLLAGVAGPFDLVVSNPPYIAADDPRVEPGVRRFEPGLALFSGADGLDAIRRLLVEVPPRLAPGGALLVEVGAEQAPAASEVARAAGWTGVVARKDLSGVERVLELTRS